MNARFQVYLFHEPDTNQVSISNTERKVAVYLSSFSPCRRRILFITEDRREETIFPTTKETPIEQDDHIIFFSLEENLRNDASKRIAKKVAEKKEERRKERRS